jgi:quercetin dioxygenase-like cupin family protein
MNAGKRGLLGGGALIALVFAAGAFIGVGGMAVAHHDVKETAKPISAWDIVEKLDGKETRVSVVEVTLEPGQAGKPHRHAGPVIGYVLEGEYEWAIDDNKPKILKAGDTFYEPTGCLHGVGRNPSKKNKARFIAIVLHPEDAKDVVIPEKKK